MLDLPDDNLVPSSKLFLIDSDIHGYWHVARVMIHAMHLIQSTGRISETIRLWAAVYLHDLARTHDGVCHRHGADSMRRFEQGMPETHRLFAEQGVKDSDYEAIRTAVIWHCVDRELHDDHPHALLTHLLKDADALDRVRLGFDELDPHRLRFPHSRGMIPYAEMLYRATQGASC